MIERAFAAAARKRLLRAGRALLRLGNHGPAPAQLGGLSEDERDELAEIHAALERIERGIYGRCEACFADITLDRLEGNLVERVCSACAHPVSTDLDAPAFPTAPAE
jgi:hypothetical protein